MSNDLPSSNKRSGLKTLVACLGALALLAILTVLSLPLFFSTTTGKNILATKIGIRNDCKLEIGNLSLSWFGSQRAREIRLVKPQEQLVLTCDEIFTDASLLKILFKKDLGHLTLKAPHLQLSGMIQPSAHLQKRPVLTAGFVASPSLAVAMPAMQLSFSGNITIEKGKVDVIPPQIEPIHFDQIAMTMELARKSEAALTLDCVTTQQQLQGKISLKGSASQLNSSFPDIALQASLSQLPVRGIDQIAAIFSPRLNGLIYAAVGETIDLQCHFTAAKGSFDLSLDAQSPQINAQIATQTTDTGVSLKGPASLSFNLTPTLFQKIGKLFPSLKSLNLTQPALIQGALSQFSCPLPATANDLLKSSFQAQADAPPQMFFSLNGQPLLFNNLHLKTSSPAIEQQLELALSAGVQTPTQTGSITIEGTLSQPFSKTPQGSLAVKADQLPTDLIGIAVESPIALSTWLGPTVDLSGSFQTGVANPKLHLSWQSQFLKIPSFDLSLSDPWTLVSPAPFTLVLNPQLASQGEFKIAAIDPIQGTLQNLLIPPGNIKNSRVNASVNTGQITLAGDFPLIIPKLNATLAVNTFDQISVKVDGEPLHGSIQWDAKTRAADVQFSSQVLNPSGPAGSLQGQFTVSLDKEMNLNRAAIQGSLELQNLSPAALDAFSGKTMLGSITGPVSSAKLKLQSSFEKQDITIKWVSPNVNIDAAFVVDNASIRLQGSANQITWTLTPESYSILDRTITGPNPALTPFEMSESTTFAISLTKLSLPVIPKKEIHSLADRIPTLAIDLAKLQLAATGRNPKLTFLDKRSKETIQLSNLSFALNKNADAGPLSLSLDSGVVTQGTSAKNGSLSCTGELTPTFNDQGVFDLSRLTAGLQLKIQQFPSRALDLVARAQGRTDFPFTTLFGEMVNASVTMDLKNFAGPVALNVNTPLTRVDLTGHLVNGALLLNDSLHAQMKITPEISRLVLKEVNPLNLSYVYSQAPITLQIPAEGFYFPLYPFSAGKIAIPDATIELGKVACRNEGNVNITLGLLKTKQFDKSGELSLWFAPIDLSIKQGLASIDRTEILLADTFDICVWGKIDLLQNYVDMLLGLTAQTLSKAFGIKNLPENYVLTIPMKGPADNVQINTGKATTKITLLLAWQNKNITGAFGSGGALVGELLGKMATLPDSDAKVPPAKHPFPWEIGKGAKTSEASHEKKHQFKGTEKPLKQILKVIR